MLLKSERENIKTFILSQSTITARRLAFENISLTISSHLTNFFMIIFHCLFLLFFIILRKKVKNRTDPNKVFYILNVSYLLKQINQVN